jgi:hypothetical protein
MKIGIRKLQVVNSFKFEWGFGLGYNEEIYTSIGELLLLQLLYWVGFSHLRGIG